MIQTINTYTPNLTNVSIIQELYRVANWQFPFEEGRGNLNNFDQGMAYTSFKKDLFGFERHPVLNTFAEKIFNIVTNKKGTIARIYWNWYNQNSQTFFHKDNLQHNCFSILYNIHSNDGGTEFIVDNKTLFYKSNESEAILFPSLIEHRGVSPKKNKQRFSLNIIYYI